MDHHKAQTSAVSPLIILLVLLTLPQAEKDCINMATSLALYRPQSPTTPGATGGGGVVAAGVTTPSLMGQESLQ